VSGTIQQPLRYLIESARFREGLALFMEWIESGETPSPEVQVLAAQAASRIGAFELGRELAQSAQEAFQSIGNDDGVMECTNLLGALAFERGSIDDAEVQFRRVLDIAEGAQHHRFTARGANNLGNIAHLRGEPEYAGYLYEKALQAYHRAEDRRGIAETWHNLALAHRGTKTSDEALASAGRAIDAAEQLGQNGLLALTLLGRAEVFIEREALDAAVADIDRALVLAWMEGTEPVVLEAERLRAIITLRLGCPDGAHHRAELIRSRATQAGCALIAAEAASVSALALKADRRLPEANAAHDLAKASLRALGATALLARHEREWATAGEPTS
jgi:tetratricopeptide (TPR) repeat protein